MIFNFMVYGINFFCMIAGIFCMVKSHGDICAITIGIIAFLEGARNILHFFFFYNDVVNEYRKKNDEDKVG